MLPGFLVLLMVPRQALGATDQIRKSQKAVMQPKKGKYNKWVVDLDDGKQDHHGKSLEADKYEYKPKLSGGHLRQRLALTLSQPSLKLCITKLLILYY